MQTLKEAMERFASKGRRDALKTLVAARGPRRFLLCGLAGSSAAMAFAAMPAGKRPMLVVTDDADSAGYMYSDLCALLGEEAVQIFPSGYRRGIRFGQPDPPQQILRTETLAALDSKSTRFIVACPEALAEKVPARGRLDSLSLTLRKGERILLSQAVERLMELGFVKVDYVYEPGQYSVRGSLLDVYSYSHELPFRIDFFDDEIDTLRTFNVETQLSEQQVDEVRVMAPEAGGGDEGCAHRLGGLEKDAQTGAISTDPVNHEKMVMLRREKIARIANDIPELEVLGNPDADTLLVGWGGTYGHLHTAADELNAAGHPVAFTHFRYINPLPANTAEVLRRYKKVIVAELNTGMFADWLQCKYPEVKIERINKIQGQPFQVSEVVDKVVKFMEEA